MLVGKMSNREINERKENQSERGGGRGGKAENEGGNKQEYKKKGKVELGYK